MTKPSLRFMRNEHIEDVTTQRIRQYEAKVGVKVGLPVPGEEIVESGSTRFTSGSSSTHWQPENHGKSITAR